VVHNGQTIQIEIKLARPPGKTTATPSTGAWGSGAGAAVQPGYFTNAKNTRLRKHRERNGILRPKTILRNNTETAESKAIIAKTDKDLTETLANDPGFKAYVIMVESDTAAAKAKELIKKNNKADIVQEAMWKVEQEQEEDAEEAL
jgi:hypothetical protein